jgi:ABC-2 type transport system permease protein
MTAVLSAELFKLRSTRAPWAIAVGPVALTAAVIAAGAALLGDPGQPALEPSALGDLARAPGRWTGAAALLLGLLMSTGEYRFGTVLTTRLAYPQVGRLVLGKAAAAAVAGIALAFVVELVAIGGGAVMLAARGVEVHPLQHGALTAVPSIVLVTTLYAVAGVGIGELLRNPALAVGAVFGGFLLQGVLPAVLREPELARWMPQGATGSALTLGGDHDSALLDPSVGLLVLAAYAAALLMAGYGRSRTTDP